MAIFFSSLFSDLEEWSARDDVGIMAESFIRLAEPEIYRRVRIMEMEANADFTFNSGNDYTVGLPEEWLKFRFVYNTTGNNPRCLYVPPDVFHTLNSLPRDGFNQLLGDNSLVYTIEGGNIKLFSSEGSGDTVLTTGYFEGYRFAGDFDNETCPVLSRHYDVYFVATVKQLWDFVDEQPMVDKYDRMLDKLIAQVEMQEANRRQPGGPLRRSSGFPGMVV